MWVGVLQTSQVRGAPNNLSHTTTARIVNFICVVVAPAGTLNARGLPRLAKSFYLAAAQDPLTAGPSFLLLCLDSLCLHAGTDSSLSGATQ